MKCESSIITMTLHRYSSQVFGLDCIDNTPTRTGPKVSKHMSYAIILSIVPLIESNMSEFCKVLVKFSRMC